VYAALRQAAFVETVSFWRSMLAEYDRQGGARQDLADWLDVPVAKLDGVPQMYWLVGLDLLLFWRYVNAAANPNQTGCRLIDTPDQMPLTTQAVANLPATA
jgi:hypothetical protein